MKVYLIKRNKLVHCGYKAKVMGYIDTYSACNQTMKVNDEVSTGDRNEVTCKRCLKKLIQSDEKGYIDIK